MPWKRCYWPSKNVKNYNKASISGEEQGENRKIIELKRILYETGSNFISCNTGIKSHFFEDKL